MNRTKVFEEIRKMRFEEAYTGWTSGKLSQEEAARLLGVCERTFRRYINRYEEDNEEGLLDKRLHHPSHKRAPIDEVMQLTERYGGHHEGWSVKHYYSWYRRDGGQRSYNWVKNCLQESGLVKKVRGRGRHRKRRERSPWPGMMLHQDGSRHQWVEGAQWDLIVTMDDATNEHYSMFFVEEEGTESSFRGIREVIEKRGLFSCLYTDRGSHYWYTPEAGGKVDKTNPTQFGRAMQRLGIDMIAAYSPQARGRSERMFGTHQARLPRELSAHGIKDMKSANQYLAEVYMPAFNEEFMQPSMENGSAFVAYLGGDLSDILCERYERTVNNDNCVSFNTIKLQIPKDNARLHYVRVKVHVHQYPDGKLAIFHGPRKLADYDQNGQLVRKEKKGKELFLKEAHTAASISKGGSISTTAIL